MAERAATLNTPLVRRPASLWGDAWRRLLKNRLSVVGGAIVVLLIVLALFGPNCGSDQFPCGLAPYDYREQHTQDLLLYQELNNLRSAGPLPPMTTMNPGTPDERFYLLGTDQLGRDLFSRLLDGARISMLVALVVQVVVLVIGLPFGAMAAWFGGRIDNLLMRITDVIYAFPDLLFIILLSVSFRETPLGNALDGLFLVFVAIGLTSWVGMARLVRGQLLSLKEQEFVEAARAIGVSDFRIVTRHLLPNAMGPMIVAVTLGIPGAILAEATLAYLGIGAQAPRASWGSLVAAGYESVRSNAHLVVFPAIAVAVALVSFTFLGDGLRDALDPKLKGKQ